MNMPLCSRCKKNIAVMFITKIEDGKTTNQGLCLKCAKELGIKPAADLMEKFGITDDDIERTAQEFANGNADNLLNGILTGMQGAEGNESFDLSQLMNGQLAADDDDDDADDDAGDNADDDEANKTEDSPHTPTIPFFSSLFQGEQKHKKTKPEKQAEKQHKFLINYGINLTQKAKDGKLDKVVGRDSETERVIQILNRRQKNNPCLIGEPGVGKTAVAEGLAQRISEGNVPFKLENKEVWLLDMTAMVAGTQFRGQFEARMKSLIDEVKALGNIILVIDEVHNLVGAGDAEGSMNAANIMKPALSRGEIQVIGATTFKEYRKHIEKDSALERRFQPVTISEPNVEETFEILKGVKGYYESFHGVVLETEVIRQAVYLADRYINDRFMPDKAIDLIDEACSDVNLHNAELNERSKLRRELAALIARRENILQQEDAQNDETYEQIAEIKSRELQIEERLSVLEALPVPKITVDDLSKVIELWTKIPASRVRQLDYERLQSLGTRLKARIIGQDEAVDSVAAAIKRRRAGLNEKRKPVSFVFVGPTGVGKTELVKCLAQDLFDTPDALIRLDMSEYMEKHSVSKLIGAPPGYVGYDEAGQLTEKIRRRPYSVVLFDEIEKAHPDVLNMLLQILDDGRITDAQGRYVNFENAVVIMTSNAGSDRRDGAVGFGKTVTEQGREKALKALSDIMRPEFINRIDEVISFNQLSKEDFTKICTIMLEDLRRAAGRNDIELVYDDTLTEYLVNKSYSVKYGARNLRRLIEKEVEDKAAEIIISSYDAPIKKLCVAADENGVKVI